MPEQPSTESWRRRLRFSVRQVMVVVVLVAVATRGSIKLRQWQEWRKRWDAEARSERDSLKDAMSWGAKAAEHTARANAGEPYSGGHGWTGPYGLIHSYSPPH